LRIAIVGTGAMGSVYAGLLASAGHDVHAIDSWREHIDAIRAGGLRLTGASGDRRVALDATTDPREVGPVDLLVIATKAHAVEAATRDAAPLLADETVVLPIQNGLGSADRVAAIVGTARVIAGVVGGFGASIVAPGHAHHEGMELMRLGERDGPVSERVERVADAWRSAGFTVRTYDDVNRLIWEKLICNVAFSGTCAVTGATIGQVIENDAARSVALACATEAYRVARAQRIALEFDDPADYVLRFGATIGGARPSMLLDVLAGRRCEVDVINGAIPPLATSLGLEAPANATVAALVRAIQRDVTPPGEPQAEPGARGG
jgi:2-dehydropantoate 2-reductase